MVVGLLVFSLVELTGSAVVELAVLGFSSIVEILSLPFHFHHHYQLCKKGETTFSHSDQYSSDTPCLKDI